MAYSWEELKKYDGRAPESALSRPKHINVRYGYFKKQLKGDGLTLKEFIMKKIFDEHENKKFIITRNKFPYDVAENVEHLVVWLNPLFDATEEEIRDYLGEKLDDYIMYENKPGHRSVSDLKHYQLFVKKPGAAKLELAEFSR